MNNRINNLLELELTKYIISLDEFYFQRGQNVLNEWLNMDLSSEMEEKLLLLSKDYKQFQIEAENDNQVKKNLELLYEIISYCDLNAKNKNFHNKYEDKRVLAKASVRMNTWIEKLVTMKLRSDILVTGSAQNAFSYLKDPKNNITILSEDHRGMVSRNILKNAEYSPDSFVDDLRSFFSKYNIEIKNENNYTHIMARIIYGLRDLWHEEPIGLMASDTTGWQDEHIRESKDYEASIIWNSKKPTGTDKTLQYLRKIINNGESFPLFYSVKSRVCYKADIIDFAINQKDLDNKNWQKDYNIKYYERIFNDYSDNNKKAHIVFLVNSLEKITPIDVSKFKFYDNSSAPRQDNISPIKFIPEDMEKEEYFSPILIDDEVEVDYKKPLNSILYGPPGTGKTYNTINKAIEIINPSFDLSQNRKKVKNEYQRLVDNEQIVFTTFHQSMCYEDFIEGIKPLEPMNDGDNITYKVIDGIFKNLASKAAFSMVMEQETTEVKGILNFSLNMDNYIQHIVEQLSITKVIEIDTKTNKTVEIYDVSENGNLYVRHKGSSDKYTVSKNRLTKLYKGVPDFCNRNISSNDIVSIIGGCNTSVYWAVLNAILSFSKTNQLESKQRVYTMQEMKDAIESLSIDFYKNTIGKPFVLIIDEINRGNVSQIFGELITLIEENKRAGCDEVLEVVLPYSKKKFSVPKNLYIIGTMNTADRSVEALDAALRRRFTFEEMPPKADLIKTEGELKDGMLEDVDLAELLNVINKRIEKLLDKDHKIGHSYFMSVKNIDDLKRVFQKNIIPLLQEYFFGDYGKIGLVLGAGFIDIEDKELQNDIFASFNGYDSSMFNKPVYSFKNIMSDAFDIKEALGNLSSKVIISKDESGE